MNKKAIKQVNASASKAVPDSNLSQTPMEVSEENYRPFKESDFWDIVDFIDWGNFSKNLDSVDKNMFYIKLLRKFGRDFCHQAHKVERKKIAALDEIVNTYEYVEGIADRKCFGGNDGWWDTRSHIVGLGKEEFMKCVRNPQLVIDRFKERDYVENFGYWIPREDTEVEQPNSSVFINGEL